MRLISGILVALCIGCGPWTTDVGEQKKPVPVVVKDNCWEYLARLVERDKIANTDELILLVQSLRDEDAIGDAEQAAFKTALEPEQAKQRPIDKAADAAKLRAIQ